jgi:hypothetical protein
MSVRGASTLPSQLGESMPRKGYKRASGRSVGMPEVMQAQNFNRRISAEEALILATAGDGSKTDGFRNLLDLYQELHNIGFRSYMSLQEFLDKHKRISGSKIN